MTMRAIAGTSPRSWRRRMSARLASPSGWIVKSRNQTLAPLQLGAHQSRRCGHGAVGSAVGGSGIARSFGASEAAGNSRTSVTVAGMALAAEVRTDASSGEYIGREPGEGRDAGSPPPTCTPCPDSGSTLPPPAVAPTATRRTAPSSTPAAVSCHGTENTTRVSPAGPASPDHSPSGSHAVQGAPVRSSSSSTSLPGDPAAMTGGTHSMSGLPGSSSGSCRTVSPSVAPPPAPGTPAPVSAGIGAGAGTAPASHEAKSASGRIGVPLSRPGNPPTGHPSSSIASPVSPAGQQLGHLIGRPHFGFPPQSLGQPLTPSFDRLGSCRQVLLLGAGLLDGATRLFVGLLARIPARQRSPLELERVLVAVQIQRHARRTRSLAAGCPLQGLLFRCQLLGGPGLLAQAGLQLHRLQVLLKPAQPVQAVECEPATPIHATSSPPRRAARNASIASARLQVSSGRWHSTRSRAGLRSTAKSRAGLLPRWCAPNSTRSREAS